MKQSSKSSSNLITYHVPSKTPRKLEKSKNVTNDSMYKKIRGKKIDNVTELKLEDAILLYKSRTVGKISSIDVTNRKLFLLRSRIN